MKDKRRYNSRTRKDPLNTQNKVFSGFCFVWREYQKITANNVKYRDCSQNVPKKLYLCTRNRKNRMKMIRTAAKQAKDYKIEWVCRNPVYETGSYQLVRRADDAILFSSPVLGYVIGYGQAIDIDMNGVVIY